MGLFSKKEQVKVVENTTTAVDRRIQEQLEDDDNHAKSLVGLLKSGHPLVLNFKKLEIDAANKFLAFFSGAACALNGRIVRLNNTTYLFAREVDFEDGTLNDFIQSIISSQN